MAKTTPEQRAKSAEYQRQYRAKNRGAVLARRKELGKDPARIERRRELARARYAADPERGRERQRRWRKANPDRAKTISDRTRAKNAEKIRERTAKWQKTAEFKEWHKQWTEKYRAKKLRAQRERRAADPERSRQENKKWRDNNLEKARELRRKSYYADVEKSRRLAHKYYLQLKATDPDKLLKYAAVSAHARRARMLSVPGKFTKEEIADLYIRQGKKCAACKTKISDKKGPLKYRIDHVMPIVKTDESTNFITNIQLLCRRCNNIKHTKHPDEWAKQLGRLFV